MITILKQFFAWLFGTKKTSAPPATLGKSAPAKSQFQEGVDKYLEQKKKEQKAARTENRKLKSRNNRLLIEYNGKAPYAGVGLTIRRCGKNRKRKVIDRAGSMYLDRIDSLRCNDFNRAHDIIRPFREYVKQAIFTDSTGQQFKVA